MTPEKYASYYLQHYGENRKEYYNAVAPPIIQSSNFVFDTVEDFRAALKNERETHVYTRGNNPTVEILAKKMAALQGTEDALIVGSGAAAISNSVLATVSKGDHIICIRNAYTWAHRLMTELLPRLGIEATFVDGRRLEHFQEALRPNTKLVYLESPTSLIMELQDLPGIINWAKENDLKTIVDNSYAGPMNRYAVEAGADIILHSASKYISGHSDVIAGIICGSKEDMDYIFRYVYMSLGTICAPNDAWLLIRGLRTLPIRIEQSVQTTQQLLSFFEEKENVTHIHHPVHPKHPQYALGKAQFGRYMPLFSVEIDAEPAKINDFVDALQYFAIAVSWGGHESLVLPLPIHYHGGRKYIVRFYVGLEEAGLLLEDLNQAWDQAFSS